MKFAKFIEKDLLSGRTNTHQHNAPAVCAQTQEFD